MKKLLLFMCVLVMMFFLVACGDNTPDVSESTPSTNNQSTTDQNQNETDASANNVSDKFEKTLIFMDTLLHMQMIAPPVNVPVELPSREMLIFGLFIPHQLSLVRNSLLTV